LSKLLGLKQSLNDRFVLGRKLLHSFNNSMGAKGIKGINTFMDKYPVIEQLASNIPVVQYIPKGIRLAGQGIQKAENLEKFANQVSDFTGLGKPPSRRPPSYDDALNM